MKISEINDMTTLERISSFISRLTPLRRAMLGGETVWMPSADLSYTVSINQSDIQKALKNSGAPGTNRMIGTYADYICSQCRQHKVRKDQVLALVPTDDAVTFTVINLSE
jgi:hypothetical protein